MSKMKMRASLKGDVAEVKVLMNHPMETGQRKDRKTGEVIPAHFIQTVTATLNGTEILDGQLSQAVSTNPFLGFRTKAKAGDKITITWTDNKGGTESIEGDIK